MVHIGKELTGTTVAGLDLVDHQDDVVLFADRIDRFYIFFTEDVDAALALYDLDQDARDLILRYELFHILDIVHIRVEEALCQRRELGMKALLTCRRKCGQGTPVKTLVQRDDVVVFRALMLCGILTRDLHGALVRLSAGVREKDLIHPGTGTEDLRQLRTGSGVIQVGGVL